MQPGSAAVEAEIRKAAVVLPLVPKEFYQVKAQQLQTKRIKGTDDLRAHLAVEQAFWTPGLVKNNIIARDFPAHLSAAQAAFGAMLVAVGEQIRVKLAEVIHHLNQCPIGANTKLGRTFQKYQGEEPEFFHGFRAGASVVAGIKREAKGAAFEKGFRAGQEYRTAIHKIYDIFSWQPQSRTNYHPTVG
jgi:hypothetical protein